MNDFILESAKKVSITATADVIVCGGGPAGVAAAVAAARSGADTILIEAKGCLGGVWTAGMLTWLFEMEQPGLATEIGQLLDSRQARFGDNYYKYSYDVEAMKLLCEELCLEAGVKIRLHTDLVGAVVEDGTLQAVITESKSGREAWQAKVFIDCTGDGDLGAVAGCDFALGNSENKMQPWTLMGMFAVPDINQIADYVYCYHGSHVAKQSQEKFKSVLQQAGIETSYGNPTIFQAGQNLCALMINHEYGYSSIDADDLTQATINARKEISQVVNGLKKVGGGWEGITLVGTAEQIGVREGRRIKGLYELTKDDLMTGSVFPDGVCTVSFNIDIHSLAPEKDKGLKTQEVKPYQIPFRSLVAKDVKGLMMAGRCISGDWYAHASYRVTGCSVVTGEAAGTAAAYSVKSGICPDEIAWEKIAAFKTKGSR